MPGTLTPHVDRYLTGRRARAEITVGTYRNIWTHLRGFAEVFGDRPIEQLGQRHVEAWLETISHLGAGTRRGRLASVRRFCRWLIRERLIRHDPTEGIHPIRSPRAVPRALNAHQVGAVLAVCTTTRDRLIVLLMVYAGLRCCEISTLEVSDYDPRDRTLLVRGKGGHEREVPVPGELARALDEHFAAAGVVGGPMVASYNSPGRALTAGALSTKVSRWMAAAGVKGRPRDGRSAHALRHTAASDVLDVSGDLRAVQEMLGHQHLSSTEIYLRRAGLRRLRAAMEGRAYPGVGAAEGAATAA